MASRKTTEVKAQYTCKDCVHSTDWQNLGADGSMILCRCKFQKWCRFLKYDHCENFTHRN